MTRESTETPVSPASAELLLATARSELTPDQTASVRRALGEFGDWTALVKAALDHGTAGLLCHHMLTAGVDLLPPDIVDAAQAYVTYRREEHERAVRDLGVVLDVLAAAGVEALPYKGPVLAAFCYAEPAIRGCRDLDVLIHESAIDAALEALAGLGYQSLQTGLSSRRMHAYYAYNGQDALVAEGRMPVEPHWRLNPRTLHADIDTEGLFRRSGTIALNGREIPAPSREDTLLICGMHGCKEEWARLIWIADVAALLRGGARLDWTAILARADAAGTRRMLLIGLALAEAMLGADLPPVAVRALTADRMARRLAETAARRLFARGGETPSVYHLSGFRLRMRERLSDQARYIAATLLTARTQHFRFVDLPAELGFLYPLVRLGHDYVALPLWRLAHPRAR